MRITEVRIKLMEDPSERLMAFCSITLDDCFVVRDLKIIQGQSGPFVAMPSRKIMAHCPNCGCKNHLKANYCNQCGRRLPQETIPQDEQGRVRLYADIAHPINSACREQIQQAVIQAYEQELKKAQQPGYVSSYEDMDLPAPGPHIAPGRKPSSSTARPRTSLNTTDSPAEEGPPAG